MDRVAWIVAGIVGKVSPSAFLEFLGMLGDDSEGAAWKANHGLVKTAFDVSDSDPQLAHDEAVAKFQGMVAKAGLGAETIKVLACVVSPPAPHVGWEWPAELRNPTT